LVASTEISGNWTSNSNGNIDNGSWTATLE